MKLKNIKSYNYLLPKFKIKAIIANPRELITNTTVYLFNKDKRILLPIKMTCSAAEGIILAKDKESEPRPHIHNTATRLITALGARVDSVIINKCKSKIFYSHIRVTRKGKVWDVDAKPSDSMAIAVRLNVPIYVKKCVYQKAGIKVTRELLEKSLSI